MLRSNKEKYSARLQEPAEIWTQEPGVLLENYPDVFEGNGGTSKRLPVYTIDPRVVELCKTDAPQWIVMYWTAHLNDPISLSLHKAILNNVDFQYIYDYFFDPDKVKGQPYKPLRSPSFTETVVAGKPSETADEERGGSRRGVLRRFFLIARGQEAPQLAQHAGQHRRLQRRHGVEGTGRSLGGDGRHGDQADGHEDTPAA